MSTWAPGNYDGATYEYDAFDNIRRNVLGQLNASPRRDLRYEYNTSTNRLSGLGFPNGTVFAQYQHDPRGNLTRGFLNGAGVVALTVGALSRRVARCAPTDRPPPGPPSHPRPRGTPAPQGPVRSSWPGR